MQIVVTGGAGFLGARLIRRLLDDPRPIGDETITRIVSLDRTACPVDDPRVISLMGDLRDPALLDEALTADTQAVCHLAAVVSAQAEADFELGMAINVDATRSLLDACRNLPKAPRFLMTSSLAVFGPEMPEPLNEHVAPMPRSSYGSQKAIGELLVNDYSRKGFIDGRVCRLPTVVVRPGRPNQAASSFASSIIRKPLAGGDAVCPVDVDQPLWLSSPAVAVTNLAHALRLDSAQLAGWRTLNMPGITRSVREMLDALARVAGPDTVKRVHFEHDPRIHAIVSSWPARFDISRVEALGFVGDSNFDDVIHQYVRDEMASTDPTKQRT